MATWPYSTAAWQRLRLAKLRATPLCEVCTMRGQAVPARAVDHIKSIASGGPAFPPLDGLMSMCVSCHSVKTAAEDNPAFGKGKSAKFKGCAVDGSPLDPADDWWEGAEKDGESGGRERRGNPSIELVVANDSQKGDDEWV